MPNDEMQQEIRDLEDMRSGDYDVDDAARALEDAFLGDDIDTVGQPGAYRPVVPQAQPCNKATMVCLRGPCRYLWSMTTRFGADDGTKVHIQRHRVCMRHNYETQLADVNVYSCEGWHPAPLAFLPDSIWSVLQRVARSVYERWLERRGYNFEWRWFSLDSFEWDDPERRRFSGPGGGHLYDAWVAKRDGTTGYGADVPEDKE